MPRVSAERLFRSHFPNATAERRKRHIGPVYFLVRRQRGEFMWAGRGATKAQAWADACERYGITAIKEDVCSG